MSRRAHASLRLFAIAVLVVLSVLPRANAGKARESAAASAGGVLAHR